jgi:hypothetical protein
MLNAIKKLLPHPIKHLLWYVFKSPQRQWSEGSLYRDIKGICYLWYYRIFPPRKLKPVTICTGLYNRSEQYVHVFLESLKNCHHKDLITLSVFDCGSDDIPHLQHAIQQHWDGPLVFQQEQVRFTRSYSLNKAINASPTSLVFICDADMSVPAHLVRWVNSYVSDNRAWFPICFFMFKNAPLNDPYSFGEWKKYDGTGMVGCTKEAFEAVGKFDEKYTVWGEEDTDLWMRFHKNTFVVIRNKQKGLLHHWHTSENPKYQHMNP